MKQLFLACLIFSQTFFSAHLFAAPGYHIPDVDVDMQFRQVSPRVYYVAGVAGAATENKGFISNAVLIVTDEGAVVFDALGSPSLAQLFVRKVKAITSQPIKKVFVSHYHADHIYGLQVFRDLGSVIYAPAGSVNYYRSEGAQIRLNERRQSLKPWVNKDTRIIEPDQNIAKDFSFDMGGVNFSVIHFGSTHSHGDLALFVESEKVLLSGDLVFSGRIPFVGGNEIDSWIEKIDSIAVIPANHIIPGHGLAFSDLKSGVSLTRSYLQLLKESMSRGVQELMSFEDIYQATDWGKFSKLPAFKQGNRGNAYRVFLATEAKSLE